MADDVSFDFPSPLAAQKFYLAVLIASRSDKKLSLGNFRVVCPLGTDPDAVVQVVENNRTGSLSALTRLPAAALEDDSIVQSLWPLLVPENPFISKLKSTFSDGTDIYLETEYPLCGRFNGSNFRRTALELIFAVRVAHGAGIVLGPIRPENVMIDVDGHVKLTEFGLRSKDPEGPFIAPEVAEKGHFSFTADWFAIGAILFTALVGREPDPNTALPSWTDDDLKTLLSQLLSPGRKRRTDAEIEKMPFLSGVDWKVVSEKQLEAEDDDDNQFDEIGDFNQFGSQDLDDIVEMSQNLLISGFD
jgi:serine/threonine protein kinase